MKRKIFSILFALVLVVSLSLVAAVPVSAASVSEPSVIVTPKTISTASAYTITFDVTTKLLIDTDWIEVRFPSDTTVPAAGWAATDVTIQNTVGTWDGVANTVGNAGGNVTVPATRTVKITLAGLTMNAGGDFTDIFAGSTVKVIFVSGGTKEITNPSTAGDYTLEVCTSKDTTWKTSASYSIEPLGAVHVYNTSGLWMKSYSGATALEDCESTGGGDTNWFTKANYTIEVGPGTYTFASSHLVISGEGLTLKSTDGPASTIVLQEASMGACAVIYIQGAHVTVEGFTVDGGLKSGTESGIAIKQAAAGVTVQDNIITGFPDHAAIALAAEDAWNDVVAEATISGNVIEDCKFGIYLLYGVKDNTISGNTITGCTGSTGGAICLEGGSTACNTQGNTISGNTITDNAGYGIWLKLGYSGAAYKFLSDNVIEGNTISGNSLEGIKIDAALDNLTDLVITDNDITDNTKVGIVVGSWDATLDTASAIKFNNITGNDTINGYGLKNTTSEATVVVDATHNWWGTAVSTGIAAMINDTSTGVTDYTPFLSDTVDTIFSATAVDTNVASLNAETEVGVVVSSTTYTPYVVSAAKYIANPGAPLDNALAFYDVYEAGAAPGTTDTVTLKFYAGDDEALLWAWSSISLTWIAVSPAAQFNEFGGFLHVTLKASTATVPTVPAIEDLNGTPFAISGEEEEEPFDPWVYDDDGDDVMEITEVLTAITDYFAGLITITEVLEVITLYF